MKKYLLILTFFLCLFSLFGQNARNTPIEVNLIIDGSITASGVKDDIIAWISKSLINGKLINGDKVTIWNAGETARVIYSDTIKGNSEKEDILKTLRSLPLHGTGSSNTDFPEALRQAVLTSRQSSGLNYTLLVSASSQALSSVLSGANANLLQFSRVEEFSGWRVFVIGLNLEAKVKNAATAFLGS